MIERFTNRVNRRPYIILAPAGPDIILSKQTPVAPSEQLYRQVLSVNGAFPDAQGNIEISTSVGSVEWDNVLDKPTTFTPSPHTHPVSDVTGLQSTLDGKEALGAASSAVSNHVAASDPHVQYHTDTRGDARYYTKSQVDSSLSSKANTSDIPSLTDTPRFVKFSTTWPARGSSTRATFFIGGSAATDAPSDINIAVGDVWIPASE